MAAVNKTGSAYYDFTKMIEKSWTFQRMTAQERTRCYDALHNAYTQGAVKGTYKARWDILNAIYDAYLMGIGYSGFNWRETEPAAGF